MSVCVCVWIGSFSIPLGIRQLKDIDYRNMMFWTYGFEDPNSLVDVTCLIEYHKGNSSQLIWGWGSWGGHRVSHVEGECGGRLLRSEGTQSCKRPYCKESLGLELGDIDFGGEKREVKWKWGSK